MASQRTSGKPGRRSVDGVRARLSDESGLALVLALVVVAALSVATASLIMLVTSNQTAVGRDRQEERAFNIAEAGPERGCLVPLHAEHAEHLVGRRDELLASTAAAASGGPRRRQPRSTVDTWTLYAQATSGKSTRKVSVKLAANKSVISTPSSASWGKGFFVADATICANHERHRGREHLGLRRRQPLPDRKPARSSSPRPRPRASTSTWAVRCSCRGWARSDRHLQRRRSPRQTSSAAVP